jgi:hypothetical protein
MEVDVTVQKHRLHLRPADMLRARSLSWLINRPLWLAVLMPGLLISGLLFGLGIFPEGRVINPFKQYLAASLGDLFLWWAFGWLIYLAIQHFEDYYYRAKAWRIAAIIMAVLASLALSGAETWALVFDPHGPFTYTRAQFFSPTHLAHMLIVPFWTYVGVRLSAVLAYKPNSFYRGERTWVAVCKGFVVVGIVGWATCVVLDNFVLPRPNLAYVHPLDGGWFGGWWPHVFHWVAQLF